MEHAARWVLGSIAVVASCGAAGCVTYGGTQQTASVSVVANVTQAAVNNGPRLDHVPDVPAVPGARVDGATIRAALDLHGNWVEDGTYGTVWVPSQQEVGGGFVPYGTNGQWVLTDAGWYWQSTLAWGWLTFHYGRWVMLEEQWGWVPGAMFAPAWVDWRVGNGWIGWAPLPPRGAAFTAPYAFCHERVFGTAGFWSGVVYGAGAASLYGSTVSLSGTYGVGGAVYAWGPAPSTRGGAGPVATPVSLGTAWHNEVAPRAGVPTGGGGGMVASNSPSSGGDGSAPRTGVPVSGSGAGGGGASGHGVAAAPSVAMQSAAPPNGAMLRPDGLAPVRSAAGAGEGLGHFSPVPTTPIDPVAPYPGTGYFNRYRAPDTVVIRNSVPDPGPIRHTVSLGTAESSVPSSVPSWASNPPPVYSNSVGASAGSWGGPAAAVPAAAPSPSYAPPPSVSSGSAASTWTPPVATSMPPAYGAGSVYAPQGVVHVPSGPVAPAYAPPANVGYGSGVSYGVSGGGYGGGGYAAPVHAPAYAPPVSAPMPAPHFAPSAMPVVPPPAAAPVVAPRPSFAPTFVSPGAYGRVH